MHVSSLENFRKEIYQIREYIKHIQHVNNVVADYTVLEAGNEQIKGLLDTLKEHYREFRTSKKIFEYKAIIISLYGLLEKSVEAWIKEYLDALSNIVPEYNQIDNTIREKHFELSLKLISTITSRESAKYQYLTKEQVLKRLNDCIENSSNYRINTEAFVLLSGNLKHDKVVELFKPLNVNLNEGLKRNQTLTQYIRDEQQIENISNLNTDILYNKINDLVEMRNQIAHGSEAVDDILDHSVLENYIRFLENYCQAIFEILNEEEIKQESVHKFQKIENVIDIFRNEILAFEIENSEIKVGDILIVKTANGRFFNKPILEIQIDKVSYPQKTITTKINIAVKVEPTIKKNQEFFIKKANV